jgi:transcriptional regulator with XRE-family HTH domain
MADMKQKASGLSPVTIQEAREGADLSREGLAFKSGISLRTIERIEAGQVRPHRATRAAIAAALGIDPKSLAFGADRIPASTGEVA